MEMAVPAVYTVVFFVKLTTIEKGLEILCGDNSLDITFEFFLNVFTKFTGKIIWF